MAKLKMVNLKMAKLKMVNLKMAKLKVIELKMAKLKMVRWFLKNCSPTKNDITFKKNFTLALFYF